MKIKKQIRDGFTLLEVSVILGVLLAILGLTTFSLVKAKKSADLTSSINVLTADLKKQQMTAMTGDTEGRGSTDDYGIHFGITNYSLFHGAYSPSALDNLNIAMGDQVSFLSTTGPELIFSKGTGEIKNFSGTYTIVLTDSAGLQKTITLNKYGVITAVQ